MKITNCGSGIHQREIVGINKLAKLPDTWYAYTNLDLIVSRGKSREIDVIIVADERIFLVDLKDWGGQIRSSDGHWFQNNIDRGKSPVLKISEAARELSIQLEGHLRKHAKGQKVWTPKVQSLVVITAKADISGIAPTESASVMMLDDFMKGTTTPAQRIKTFGTVHKDFVDEPISGATWKHRLTTFFNVRSGIFKPGEKNYGGFHSSTGASTFAHRQEIYAEYDVTETGSEHSLGTLRLWDFGKAETRFQNADGRAEIAGREQEVLSYLRETSDECETAVLHSRASDPDKGVAYWEVYERRRTLKRLYDFAVTDAKEMTREQKLVLAAQLLLKVSALHSVGAAHMDIGGHSVWLQRPSTIRLSHLMAASYPQINSLGESRYQFLASSKVPEQLFGDATDPKRRDIFLLGVAIHYLLFSSLPISEDDDLPVEWRDTVDDAGDYRALHAWFGKMLAFSPADRFSDAGEALRAFNAALATLPSSASLIRDLERFSAEVSSHLRLMSCYPLTQVLRDDARSSIWKSVTSEGTFLLKVWKRACWGDQTRELPRLLDFLTRVSDLVATPPKHCAKYLKAFWLNDALAVVQEWHEGKSLAQVMGDKSSVFEDSEFTLKFLTSLIAAVDELHERGLSHGDLKPENILLSLDNTPHFIDLIDFGAEADGEISSSAYSPSAGGRFERDRFAVTRIAEELLALTKIAPPVAAQLKRCIDTCRNGSPPNATLLPLLEAIEDALNPEPIIVAPRIRISMRQVNLGEILPDEGFMYFRRVFNRNGYKILSIRGACEELQIEFNNIGKPFRGRRFPLDQKSIASRARDEFLSRALTIQIVGSDVNDFNELSAFLEDSEFIAKWDAQFQLASESDAQDEHVIIAADDDAAEDELVEQIERPSHWSTPVDVSKLWRRLIDIEGELTIEAVAADDSSYRRELRQHVVPIELVCGSMDFSTNDRVLVEKLQKGGHWWKIAHLNLTKSTPTFVALDVSRFDTPSSGRLVESGQRLRFTSFMEESSRERREHAISRILSQQSCIADLLLVFDSVRVGYRPERRPSVDPSFFKTTYALNDSQADAMATIVSVRPVGLLQGPPGTGKTVFIAALAHYALTHGLARNVLLASQSHEAVNHAAESVLKRFSATDKIQPSIIRVGNEGYVSERLLPFHVGRVQQLYKDRMHSSLEERLRGIAMTLGIPSLLADKIIFVETVVGPVVRKLADLDQESEDDAEQRNSLRATIDSQIDALTIESLTIAGIAANSLLDYLCARILQTAGQHASVSEDRIVRLRSVVRLARDFINSVPNPQRNFETFLAGTREIVAGTCVGLGRTSLGLTSTAFDLVIVDEAARCTASELSVPIQSGRWVVLVGDQAQLEPLHKAGVIKQVSREMGISAADILRSDFERSFTTEYGQSCGKQLTTQYRMLAPIGRVVSSCFYDDILEHGRNKPIVPIEALPPHLEQALLWIDTKDLGERAFQKVPPNSKSLRNPLEVDAILRLLQLWDQHEPFMQWLKTQDQYETPIGIICTYAKQRDLLRSKLQGSSLSTTIKSYLRTDTVDSYQGKENPIVILSLVRNNDFGSPSEDMATIKPGFLARSNRVNVSISRAMDRLVIVGATGRWGKGLPLDRVANAFRSEVASGHARIMSAEEILLASEELPKKNLRESKPLKLVGAP